jgi:hyperosmotically inducible periplasmic protein
VQEEAMKRIAICFCVLGLAVAGAQQSTANRAGQPGGAVQDHITREVRHELLMLSYYGVFDNLAYGVNGTTVTLVGEVTRPTLKSDAENAVKRVEGVTSVVNQIRVLPLSPTDDRIRMAEYRAIYSQPGLDRYALQTIPPIHIIVENGHVTLVGVVASAADKQLAAVRANSVSGVFSVDNKLTVETR